MAIVNHFYNGTTRKYVAIFGTTFNQIKITRATKENSKVQEVIVPISYGPFQKFLARIEQDPDLNNPSAITLPRMSFEILNMAYDGTRKIGSKQKILKNLPNQQSEKAFVWSGAPYNIDFSLYIMTKYAEDATKIVEQIIPFFRPEYTVTAKLIDGIEPIDIPMILNSVTNEELYEGSFEERRSVLWTLNFTMKAWYFGPTREKKYIKFVETDTWAQSDETLPPEQSLYVYPGLTADGTPSSDPDNTIPYEEINLEDDWGVVQVVDSNPEDEDE